MTSPYFVRFVCICLACFYLIHLVLSISIALSASRLIRMSERLRPSMAARLMLVLRLLPSAIAVIAVAALCAPSYLWLEPKSVTENLGFLCMTAALLALMVWVISAARSLTAIHRSRQFVRHFRDDGPFLALAGIIRPKVIVSRGIVNMLSADQLAVTLEHEHAHRTSRDNLKRLLILLAPEALPFFRGMDAVQQAWAKFTEWAADDSAVAGDPHRSLLLAEALVRVARFGVASPPSPLIAPLLADSSSLGPRIERLMRPRPPAAPRDNRLLAGLASLGTLLFAGIVVAALNPTTIAGMHNLLEALVR
jgi:Zn-dependent protease with chaperone function